MLTLVMKICTYLIVSISSRTPQNCLLHHIFFEGTACGVLTFCVLILLATHELVDCLQIFFQKLACESAEQLFPARDIEDVVRLSLLQPLRSSQ